MNISRFRSSEEKGLNLAKIDPKDTGDFKDKEDAEKALTINIKKMIELQYRLYAVNSYAVLIIFQAMDTAGKDGAIKHVMSGLNPQSTQVYSFKQPSSQELNHDYLWRVSRCLPERGCIGIFNRSYYEEVLVVRVHNMIKKEKIPPDLISGDLWKNRFREIRDFERYLFENGIIPVKFFLHISKEEQRQRLLSRIEDPSKNWKFSEADVAERAYWDHYMKCYGEVIRETGASYAPWYIIPSDKKWFARLAISEIIIKTMENLNLNLPEITEDQLKKLSLFKNKLLEEQD